jgi:hypothetical protein
MYYDDFELILFLLFHEIFTKKKKKNLLFDFIENWKYE